MSLSQNRQTSILVVEPDADHRRIIQELLMADGYSCRTVATAAAAKQAVAEKSPNLLISEVALGDVSGLALYRELSELMEFPAMFVTESRDRELIREAQLAGGTYCLTKPIDPAVLLELVDKALWMPHLVRRHVDATGHALKAPSFVPARPATYSTP
jgi:two-component system response regulator FlrC